VSEIDDIAAFMEERVDEAEGKAENLAGATCLAGEWAAFSGILEGQAMRGEPVDKVMAIQVRALEGVLRKMVAEWAGHPGYKAKWKA